ncbi:hypothetical protein P691DRAFT_840564 [Macrolepiota fuliginosa MF-IS2]|uniref:Transmembrane protein n=1 Tax=Macrolepiota fuliginosa MF-IS2 TaxID=1400762 RepID=A0A9P6BZR6_9AGAR|nr:hypothetical protein P691DRAFT_840564 [Macrolepiota fuliginosa MF-IS2]
MSQADTAIVLIEGKDPHPRQSPNMNPYKSSRPFPEITSKLLFSRYTLFATMELGFTAFAYGLIAIFTFWHTVAVACALTICYDTFSREWAACPDEKTDKVSTVTSGVGDRVRYSFQGRATKSFRTAFLAFIGLTILHTMGLSTITVTSGIQLEENLHIGLISTSSITPNSTNSNTLDFQVQLAQANMVVRLEQLLRSPWGYVPQPNWLIPLPAEGLGPATTVEYETDLAEFHYTCQWQAPESFSQSSIVVGGQTWGGGFQSNASSVIDDLSRVRNGSSILQLLPESYTGLSAYMFLGGNSTVAVNSTSLSEAWVDLNGLPSTFNPDGFATHHHSSSAVDWVRAPLATILICDPRLRFVTGSVLLNPSTNLTATDITVRSIGGIASPGNIDPTTAKTLFTAALTTAIGSVDLVAALRAIDFSNFNSVAAYMLLALPASRDWDNLSAIRPLDIKTINRNVDSFTLSALKSFTSGYRPGADIRASESVSAAVVKAQYTSGRLSLATSVQFAVLHSVLFCILAVTLAVLTHLNRTQGRSPFDLAYVKRELGY